MSDAAGRRGLSVSLAASLIGAVFGVGAAAGAALLLVAGPGVLSTAGFLIGLALAALAAALWVGTPDGGPMAMRGRWALAVGAMLIAGSFAEFWSRSAPLRGAVWGRGLAVLVLVAAPAYAVGTVLAGLQGRGRGTAVMTLAGAAVGVLLAGAALIPRLDPGILYTSCATALIAAAFLAGAARTAGQEGETMRDKVVIVTGAGRPGQMGYALAERFAREGARVVATSTRHGIEEVARELGAIGVAADLTREEEAERVVATARDTFGRLDVVVNVAGGLTVIKPLGETGADEWERELERNARTAFLLSRAALPLLRESRGAIVNFASPAGLKARAWLGAYSAAKAAVVALTRALALEEKDHGVRVNAVAPGMIDTEENRRSVENLEEVGWVTRDEVADVVLFLASPASAGVSGQVIEVLGKGLE